MGRNERDAEREVIGARTETIKRDYLNEGAENVVVTSLAGDVDRITADAIQSANHLGDVGGTVLLGELAEFANIGCVDVRVRDAGTSGADKGKNVAGAWKASRERRSRREEEKSADG